MADEKKLKRFDVILIPREGEQKTFEDERPTTDEDGNPTTEKFERPYMRNVTVLAHDKNEAKDAANALEIDHSRQVEEPPYEIAEVNET